MGKKNLSPIVSRFSPWIRLYSSTRHDPKILSLSDRQKWQWMVLLMVAGETEDGILPSPQHIACELRCTTGEATELVDNLVLAGLLDIIRRDENGVVIRPHNWDRRQFKSDHSGAARTRRWRTAKRHNFNGVTSHVTKPKRHRSDSVSVSGSVFHANNLSSQEGKTLSVEGYTRDGGDA